ncbi:MAG TPA: hypothetical protein ENJ90_11690 [Devosia sp.]|nr:hypothetical protein [Devosia sp.]
MSFLTRLFGGDAGAEVGVPKVLGEEEYKGFSIRALEMKAGSEFQLCGEIEKTINGEAQVKEFIRADKLSTADQAASVTLAKGRQIIDEQGEGLFESQY